MCGGEKIQKNNAFHSSISQYTEKNSNSSVLFAVHYFDVF